MKKAIEILKEKRDSYHNWFMSKDRVSMMQQIEHDDIMSKYNWAINFFESLDEDSEC
jgi:hypothetical protein